MNSNSDSSPVINPFNGECIKHMHLLQETDLPQLINSTDAAFREFRNTNAAQRAQLLERIYTQVEKYKLEFITHIVNEAGKPISYATVELERCLQTIQFGIHACYRTHDEVIPMNFGLAAGRQAFTLHMPSGPVLAFSPFNFPLNLALHKIIPAIVAGNSIVLKAPPQAPSAALLFAEIVAEAGAPEGLLNVVVCTNEIALKLVEHPVFTVFSFTGSSEVAWKLKAHAGKKKVLLEGGGNAAVIIDNNTDIESIAKRVAYGSFLYAGQICISTQRIYAVQEIALEFQKAFLKATAEINSGNPQLSDTINGPLIHPSALQRIENQLKEAEQNGANILIGGQKHPTFSTVLMPTIITNTSPEMAVVNDEIFGPVAILESVANFDSAIKAVNNSRFGLQCGVFTNNLNHMKSAMQHIETGAVIFNDIPGFRVDNMPYGGIKDSGLGREGIDYVVKMYTDPKLIVF